MKPSYLFIYSFVTNIIITEVALKCSCNKTQKVKSSYSRPRKKMVRVTMRQMLTDFNCGILHWKFLDEYGRLTIQSSASSMATHPTHLPSCGRLHRLSLWGSIIWMASWPTLASSCKIYYNSNIYITQDFQNIKRNIQTVSWALEFGPSCTN